MEIKTHFDKLIGKSAQMQRLYNMISKVSRADSTVLITGESGTGKELVAQAIHKNSARAENPFIPLNCGAIPKDLLESELFGHEKGAFTGAINTRKGRFELADKGTILLDEIGELHPSLQVKLLRVLQEREFERVGGTRTVKVDIRILAATNKDLGVAAKNGNFREDLYYRLNVIPIHISPLRERKDDIPLLIEHFINRFIGKFPDSQDGKEGQRTLNILPEAIDLMLNYQWPGNVRELETLIERFVILDETGTITQEDLPPRFSDARQKAEFSGVLQYQMSPEGIDLQTHLDDIETSFIIQAMEISGGVKSKAAALLGLNRTTFLEKLKKKGLDAKLNESPIT
ncbi:sigma-54 interaction domain-containing protein [Candidatus Magnetominusculus xianensis]|uniref:Sigma-54-dependent Fis family transcriptional regulator n=1 Tax=Candidatus Magnetominusculus xianensis TaxID=1748249 RepID=A0ABR5SGD2_9BACT|nr:sigma-54 dependent transcriptional regulator [Candidatus Magnetominusculus xianensis]KWT85147.1 sigma-54-dependent Fis family transcriptional regulator [Candidatus Magnetominusculus xianensis]MBF0405405.1 sigma-54-dependent Fis family transcriptional regulator [Nitrospirota bacterium]